MQPLAGTPRRAIDIIDIRLPRISLEEAMDSLNSEALRVAGDSPESSPNEWELRFRRLPGRNLDTRIIVAWPRECVTPDEVVRSCVIALYGELPAAFDGLPGFVPSANGREHITAVRTMRAAR
jgi:hypothetical protein